MINLTINGKSIEVREGTTVLNAARQSGIEIPTLCDHAELTPYGGCRLCLVEVEGIRTLQPSCTLPASNGMIVKTDTDRTRAARKFILTLIFSERNHFCPFCQVSGGDCELQNAAYHEEMTHWPIQPNWKPYPMDASHPYIILENNRCILCRRCVRACDELVGNFTLAFEDRGPESLLVADLGVPLGASSCISCGACVQVCPTGALIDRPSAYMGKETEVEKTTSICVGCSLGCGVDLLTRNNRLVRIEGNWNAEVNGGALCKIGRFLPLDEKRERLTTPLIKQNGNLVQVDWKKALARIAETLQPFAGKAGKDVAAVASSKLPIETLHAFKQLFKEQMKAEITTTLDGKAVAAAAKLAGELGKSFEAKLADLKTSDCVLCLGIDPARQHEVASFFFKRNIPSGTKVIVIDPEENQMSAWAEISFKPKKGIDSALIRSLATVTDSKDPLNESARIITAARKPFILYGKSLPVDTLKELVDFAGKIHAQLLGLKGGANSLVAALLGLDQPFAPKGAKATFVALADEEPSPELIKSLEGIPFLVVLATHASRLTALADVVLPVQLWSEQGGSYVNLEGKLQKSSPALTTTVDIKSELAALQALAEALEIKLTGDWKKDLALRTSPVAIEL